MLTNITHQQFKEMYHDSNLIIVTGNETIHYLSIVSHIRKYIANR